MYFGHKDYIAYRYSALSILDQFQKLLFPLVTKTQITGKIGPWLENTGVTLQINCPSHTDHDTELPLGESYQSYQVRTPCIAQEMRGEALKGDRCRSPRGDHDKLQRQRESGRGGGVENT